VSLWSICAVHVETRSTCFLIEPQNQDRRFVSGLTSKPLGQFSPVCHQNRWLSFSGLGLKTGSSGLVFWALKSSRRFLGLGLKTKRVLVCRLRHKTDGGRTLTGLGFFRLVSRLSEARRQMVNVTSSQRLHQGQVEDEQIDTTGCVRPCYSYFTIFYVLDYRSIVVFYLGL
jgi:hypothetical protein